MTEQAEMWETPRPAVDPRPLETGGALVILHLTPTEVEALAPLAATLDEAVHAAVAAMLGRGFGG